MSELERIIKHCEDVALVCDAECQQEVARENRMIAQYLTLLKNILDLGDCNNCSEKNHCRFLPKYGAYVRYNCPFYNGRIWHDGEVGETDG